MGLCCLTDLRLESFLTEPAHIPDSSSDSDWLDLSYSEAKGVLMDAILLLE